MLPNVMTLTALLALAAGNAAAMDDAALARAVDARLSGDRTGACFAVAVIERERVARTYRCADGTAHSSNRSFASGCGSYGGRRSKSCESILRQALG